MTFDLVIWPLTLSCDLQVRHNVKVPIVHLWSKFGYNWSEPVRTGAIWKRLTQTLTDGRTNGRTDWRTYRIWIAMCLHEHSFRRHKNACLATFWWFCDAGSIYTFAKLMKQPWHVPATRSTGTLAGCSSIWRAIHWPSKWAYHHPLCGIWPGAADSETVNGTRKYLWRFWGDRLAAGLGAVGDAESWLNCWAGKKNRRRKHSFGLKKKEGFSALVSVDSCIDLPGHY